MVVHRLWYNARCPHCFAPGGLAADLFPDVLDAGDRLAVAQGAEVGHAVVEHVVAALILDFGHRVVGDIPEVALVAHVVPDGAVDPRDRAALGETVVVELPDRVGQFVYCRFGGRWSTAYRAQSGRIEVRRGGNLRGPKRCAELFKNREKIDGIIVTLPNFGEERAIADTLRLAGLNVPVLVQATPDRLR